MSGLKTLLQQWDNKDLDVLSGIYAEYHSSSRFVSSLLNYLSEGSLQTAASWLLLHHLAQGANLSKKQSLKLFEQMSHLAHWQSCLHVLQSIQYLSIPSDGESLLYSFARAQLDSPNKFVRAWSYDALIRLADIESDYREEVASFVAMANRDEAASVKARIRQLTKVCQWCVTSE
ncbi:hypothetical protein [Pleionea sp. CnH1-48]|uniref:hypothetical protein n=1 Tax=Pleionea sp. CnH1-48 TaxID=2954494 RepID=UPI0020972A87|nr:hypothetical protein [Pleionea sp. CnH1-48]MCO7225957.1 hypothetical protein [Pleionea sp. CnH1-48]